VLIVTTPKCSTFLMDQVRVMKTATDRAAEAIEAAEIMFATEMGASLDLSPAAKVALISNIAAAILAAVAEEREKLIYSLCDARIAGRKLESR
jgi:hypothetical protein